MDVTPDDCRTQLGNRVSAIASCATAVYIGLRFCPHPLQEMMTFVQHMGGDTDTIASMAGAIWGTDRGINTIEPSIIDPIEQGHTIQALAPALYRACPYSF